MNHEKKSQAECLATQRKGPCGDDPLQRLEHVKFSEVAPVYAFAEAGLQGD